MRLSIGIANPALRLLRLSTALFLPLLGAAQEDIAGAWYGELESAYGKMTLTLELTQAPLAGELATSAGIQGVVLEELSYDDTGLSFRIPRFQVRYAGKVEKDRIIGDWRQGAQTVRVVFSRARRAPTLRKQTPVAADGYATEEVYLMPENDTVTLAGTLTLPDGAGPFPAAVLLTVAGPNDRDQTHGGGHKPFLVLADYLAKRGIASLRMDDRGVGGSSGDLYAADFSVLTHDAATAHAYLRSRGEIADDQVGFIGNSEGTVIAALAAIEEPATAFVIMLGAVGEPLRVLAEDRLKNMQPLYGLDARQREELLTYDASLYDILLSDRTEAEQRIALRALAAPHTYDHPEFPTRLFFLPETKDARIELYLTPWFRSQIGYDPAGVLDRLKCATLVINGSLDVFQSPERNFPNLNRLLLQAGNPDYTIMVAPGVNHVMQEAETGFPTEYARLENTFSPLVLETIGAWLAARF